AAVTADEEFLEVPADVAGDAALRRGEEPIHGMALRAVYLELGAQRESDVVGGATERGDLRIAPGLLCGELVAGEAHYGEVLRRQLALQLFQALVLRSQAAAAGDVNGERQLAAQRAQQIRCAIDARDRDVVEAVHGVRSVRRLPQRHVPYTSGGLNIPLKAAFGRATCPPNSARRNRPGSSTSSSTFSSWSWPAWCATCTIAS